MPSLWATIVASRTRIEDVMLRTHEEKRYDGMNFQHMLLSQSMICFYSLDGGTYLIRSVLDIISDCPYVCSIFYIYNWLTISKCEEFSCLGISLLLAWGKSSLWGRVSQIPLITLWLSMFTCVHRKENKFSLSRKGDHVSRKIFVTCFQMQ